MWSSLDLTLALRIRQLSFWISAANFFTTRLLWISISFVYCITTAWNLWINLRISTRDRSFLQRYFVTTYWKINAKRSTNHIYITLKNDHSLTTSFSLAISSTSSGNKWWTILVYVIKNIPICWCFKHRSYKMNYGLKRSDTNVITYLKTLRF